MNAAATLPDMIPLVVLRHGPTDWNEAGRIQGRSDRALSEAGRALVTRWRLPDGLESWSWFVSPLGRARETAALLGHQDATVEAALIEMHWGAWEGRQLDQLRARDPDAMADNEARGLDFRPSGGESPRDVQRRLLPWLARLAEAGRPSVAVCHKGVIRALYALASGWDLRGKAPEKLRDNCAHRFAVADSGRVTVDRLNIPLVDVPSTAKGEA